MYANSQEWRDSIDFAPPQRKKPLRFPRMGSAAAAHELATLLFHPRREARQPGESPHRAAGLPLAGRAEKLSEGASSEILRQRGISPEMLP